MKETQDELRAKIKPYINSVTGIGEKFGIEPNYFYKWFNGLPVGKSTLDKIKAGIEKLGSECTDVGESHASGNTDQSPALVDGALKKITEAEKVINDFQFWCYEQRDNEQFVLALNISGAWINHLKLNAPHT